MSLSEPFIQRPAMTTLLTVTAIIFGGLAFFYLPVNDLPAVDYPVITAQVSYPGASPTTMASNIATPLERQFMQIPGLELVTSSSTQGHTNFVLQFHLSKSIEAAATDVQTAITQATGNLPADLPSPPTFSKTNPNDQPILYIAVTSNSVTAGKLYDYSNTQISQRLSIIPGVSRVDVYGTKSAVRVKADPDLLAARGITIDMLSKAIGIGTQYQAAGQLDGAHKTFLLNPRGQLETAAEYAELIIARKNGAAVYLRDVAEVKDSVADERMSMRFWARGHETPSATAVVAVNRQAGSNAVEVAAAVRAVLPQIASQLPRAVAVTPIFDKSLTIVKSVVDVTETLFIAFILVVLVIFLFLGRATDTLIPAIALPLSLLLTFGTMALLNYSLDNLSLMALTLAIGFLVDDAIVFLENTVRRMELGEERLKATINSAKEISFTILSMTLSLAAVFLPLVVMPGLIGRIFREFAVTIIVAIFASGIVSLTLTPLMCARMLAARGKGHKQTWMERIANWVLNPIVHAYSVSLTWFLKHHWISAIVWIICLGGTVWLFITLPRAFIPPGDSGFILGFQIAPEGTSYQQMREYQLDADRAVQSTDGVAASFTMGGWSMVGTNMNLVLAFLDSREKRPPIDAVAEQIRRKLSTTKGTIAGLRAMPALEISTGATNNLQGQLSYTVSGIDPEQTFAAARKMQGLLNAQNTIFAYVQADLYDKSPSLDIEVLRGQASSYGVSAERIETHLRQSFSQNYLYLIKKTDDQYQLILEMKDSTRTGPDDLGKLYISSDDGLRQIPLRAVAQWHQTTGPLAVNHFNQFSAVTLSMNLLPGVPTGAAVDAIEAAARQAIPPQVRGELRGEAKDFQETMRHLTILLLLALFVMYVILGILYESFVHPLTVLSSLPVALAGGLLTLYLFNAVASLYAFIGMFMLMGIVKKNGIMMIDFAIQRMNEGKNSVDAIHEACIDRFRPIIMTTLAALVGALPIALGYGADGESRRPLGLIIVGGLVISQLLTLYVTPVLYFYFEWLQENVLDRFSFFRSHHAVISAPKEQVPIITVSSAP